MCDIFPIFKTRQTSIINANPIVLPAPIVANQGGDQPPQANLAANLIAAVENQRRLMEEALMRLGLSEIDAHEFRNNCINSFQRLHFLTEDGLDRLIKQIHRDHQGA
jgi:hypothetical protein